MTPILPSYLSRTIHHQRWVEPEEAPEADGAPPNGGKRAPWSAATARACRLVAWLRAGSGIPTAGPHRLREAGR